MVLRGSGDGLRLRSGSYYRFFRERCRVLDSRHFTCVREKDARHVSTHLNASYVPLFPEHFCKSAGWCKISRERLTLSCYVFFRMLFPFEVEVDSDDGTYWLVLFLISCSQSVHNNVCNVTFSTYAGAVVTELVVLLPPILSCHFSYRGWGLVLPALVDFH